MATVRPWLWVHCSLFRSSSPAGLAQAAGDLEALKLGHIGRVARELSGDDYYHFSRSFSIGVSIERECTTMSMLISITVS